MLLKEEIIDFTFGLVRAKVGAFLYVEDFYFLADSCNDGCFGSLKRCFKFRGLGEFVAGVEKRFEGSY